MTSGRAEDQGFALLIVLWAVALLTLLVTQIGANGRTEAQLARNQRAAALVEADADAALQVAIFHSLDTSSQHWAADGAAYVQRYQQAAAVVRIESEAGKINPNTASLPLLQALLHNVGVDNRGAMSIAAAIIDWRFPTAQAQPLGALAPQYQAAGRDYGPPGEAFRSIDELGLVLGMTPDLLARLRPNLTVFHDRQPDPLSAGRIVLQSLRDVDPDLAIARTTQRDESVVDITIAVTADDGARFNRRAIVRMGETAGKALYEILASQDLAG